MENKKYKTPVLNITKKGVPLFWTLPESSSIIYKLISGF